MRAFLFLLAGVVFAPHQVHAAGMCPEANVPTVILSAPDGRTTAVFEVEIAATPDQRARGLMFRQFLAQDEGMLFVWPEAEPRAFWMKNTFVPLDMLFLHGRQVIGIVKNATPQTEVTRTVDGIADGVLEVAGGTADRLGIDTTWQAVFCHLTSQEVPKTSE